MSMEARVPIITWHEFQDVCGESCTAQIPAGTDHFPRDSQGPISFLAKTSVCSVCTTSSDIVKSDLKVRTCGTYVSPISSSTGNIFPSISKHTKWKCLGKCTLTFKVGSIPEQCSTATFPEVKILLQHVFPSRFIDLLGPQEQFLSKTLEGWRHNTLLLQKPFDISQLVHPPGMVGFHFSEPQKLHHKKHDTSGYTSPPEMYWLFNYITVRRPIGQGASWQFADARIQWIEKQYARNTCFSLFYYAISSFSQSL